MTLFGTLKHTLLSRLFAPVWKFFVVYCSMIDIRSSSVHRLLEFVTFSQFTLYISNELVQHVHSVLNGPATKDGILHPNSPTWCNTFRVNIWPFEESIRTLLNVTTATSTFTKSPKTCRNIWQVIVIRLPFCRPQVENFRH